MDLTAKANALLDWNRKNLIHNATITNENIASLFAEHFTVKANGRTYQANYDNYREFLYTFKATIKSIDYILHETIEAKDYVTLAMTATVTRLDDKVDKFEAILILKFDAKEKITLWHEVYVDI